MATTLRAAACHVSPVFLSAPKTTQKCISLIHQAAQNKANLVIFPETYLPAFPVWSSLRPPTENHDLFKRIVKESVYVDGEELNAIRAAAKRSNIMVSLGLSEKARFSSGTLWNSNVFIGSDGEVLNHHRKLMPTFFEKLTWSPGDGHGLKVVETSHGKIGNLICGENTNPLARYSLMAQGERVHISTWPAIWPTRTLPRTASAAASTTTSTPETPELAPQKTSRNYDNVAANRTRAAAHCFEAKAFGISCSGFLDEAAFEIISSGSRDSEHIMKTLTASQRGATMFLDPTGAALPGYTIDEHGNSKEAEYLQNEEGILYADLDVDDCVEGKVSLACLFSKTLRCLSGSVDMLTPL
jgi:nitrilase